VYSKQCLSHTLPIGCKEMCKHGTDWNFLLIWAILWRLNWERSPWQIQITLNCGIELEGELAQCDLGLRQIFFSFGPSQLAPVSYCNLLVQCSFSKIYPSPMKLGPSSLAGPSFHHYQCHNPWYHKKATDLQIFELCTQLDLNWGICALIKKCND